MTATASDSQYDGEAAAPPIHLHPAFPVIVALWFALLLGLGSLTLPVVLLDRLVAGTGLASLVPAAGPPLGMTARALVAVACGLAGAGLGALIARRVAQTPRSEPRFGKLASGSRRPISVHEELGGAIELGAVVNGEGLPINNRRALAISEDDRPSDFLYRAPLAGEDLDAPAPFAAVPIVSAVSDDDHLELCEFAQDGDPNQTDEDLAMAEDKRSNEHNETHNLAARRGPEPVAFAAPSLARRALRIEPEPEPGVRLEAVAVSTEAARERAETGADWQKAPLDGLGLVQLVQRLGSTIERRRELLARAAAAPSTQPPEPAGFAADLEPAAAEEAGRAMAAFFGSAQPLRPDTQHSLPLLDEDTEDDTVPDLSERAPAGRERRFDPPVQAAAQAAPTPRVPADADAALRAALATLQRMSGTV